MPMTHSDTPRIAIVGGGLAGLVLARVLALGGVSVTVLERDADANARAQGGSLDLHPESGQRALLAAGVIEQFHRYARPQGDEIRILDPAGQEHLRHGGATEAAAFVPDADGILPGRPEIDRSQLRSLLYQSLPAGTVHWGQHVTRVEPRDGSGYHLRTSDGSRHACDVLVGADGARSQVRRLLTRAEPEEVGVSMAMLWLHDVAAHPALDELIGQGSLWCLGDNLNVGAQRGGAGDARVSVMARRSGDLAPIRPAATRAELLALISEWSPRITDLVAAADDDVAVYEVAALPVDLSWPARPDVTLIGDAAHLMPPVGEGANQAMLDAAELARAILATPHDLPAAISSAEQAMFDRIRPIAEQSRRIQATVVSPDALTAMTRMLGGR